MHVLIRSTTMLCLHDESQALVKLMKDGDDQ